MPSNLKWEIKNTLLSTLINDTFKTCMKKLEKLKITQITLFFLMIALLSVIFILKLMNVDRAVIPIQEVLPFIIFAIIVFGMAITMGLIYGARISKSKKLNEDVHDYYVLSRYILQQTKINGFSAIICLCLVIYSYNPLLLFLAFLSVLWYIYSVFSWKI